MADSLTLLKWTPVQYAETFEAVESTGIQEAAIDSYCRGVIQYIGERTYSLYEQFNQRNFDPASPAYADLFSPSFRHVGLPVSANRPTSDTVDFRGMLEYRKQIAAEHPSVRYSVLNVHTTMSSKTSAESRVVWDATGMPVGVCRCMCCITHWRLISGKWLIVWCTYSAMPGDMMD